MKRFLRLPSLLRLTLVFFTTILFLNCTQEKIKESTDETLNITEYLRANADYSMFLEILDITNYASFMNTYGTYTLFLPTNDAVKQYLTDIGATSLKEVPLVDLQNIAKLHILDKKISTTDFTDGKIATPTLYGQYLITGAANSNGVSSTTINKTSNIVASNVVAGNGVIHVIDKVLRVANKTLAQTIEADPNLSLFTEVLKATGWYEKLNQPITYDANKVGSFFTVLTQSNAVFENTTWKNPKNNVTIKLNTLDNLKLRYSHLGDPTKAADSLNLYVQYRVIPGLSYLADFATTPVFITKAPLEVISSKLVKQDILLNEDVFNGILEKGVGIIRNSSDETSSNGVLHYVDGNFSIKKRLASPVYFDLCNQPEMAANVANYRKVGGVPFGFVYGGLSDVTWTGNKTYLMDWNPYGGAFNGDLFRIFRFRTGSGGLNDVEFKTPVIIKGRYKIWVSYRQNSRGSSNTKVFFDGVQTSRILNQKESPNDPSNLTTGIVDRVLESQGYKRYIYPHVQADQLYSRLVGIVEVPTTGRHTIKFTTDACAGCGGADADRLDMVELRPVEMDQIWPKFKKGFPVPGTSNLVQREDATKGDNSNSGY
ncbi:fasciclin domain-containing protein [Flavobacterium sp. GT2N3]|uniref:fasciclin domain-containing protein n=1 Tax=unclassified Flavobacterium TaxID=196869 RepID=UPI003AAC6880